MHPFILLFKKQLFNLIQFNAIFPPTVNDNKTKFWKKLTQKSKTTVIARPIYGYYKLKVEVDIPTIHKVADRIRGPLFKTFLTFLF